MTELNGNSILLRIFVGEADMLDHRPLYEGIVYAAKEQGLSGCTVHRGIMSFGASSRLHTSKLLDISQDLPIIIEVVDHEEKINTFIPLVNSMMENAACGGLITTEKVNVTYYKPRTR